MSDTLPAGRALDAAVAERCFGGTIAPFPGMDEFGVVVLIRDQLNLIHIPKFSTDWSAAGEVWEWLKGQKHAVKIEYDKDFLETPYRVAFINPGCAFLEGFAGDTEMHALCLAALAVAESLREKKESP